MFNILDTVEPRAKVYPTYEAYKLIFYLKKGMVLLSTIYIPMT